MDTDKNIVIVQYQSSIAMKALVRKLKELGFQAEVAEPDANALKERVPQTALFILFLPRDRKNGGDSLAGLNPICDTVQDGGKNIMVVGERANRPGWLESYPVMMNFPWLDRPINMDALRDAVETAIQGNAEEENKKRILIVDDDPTYAGMVREWIKKDYRVDIVTAGLRVMNFLRKNRVNLILLDYAMPIMDGSEVLRMLRKTPETMDIPVVFLTGAQAPENMNHIIGLKPDAYILKSTTREVLLGYIADVFGKIEERAAYENQLANARQMAYRDPLTGVKSKHAWEEAQESMNQRIKDGAVTEFGVIVCDLNDLKKVNDTQGHKAGDRYIREACQVICVCFKKSPVFRVGGDEFTVILENADYENRDSLLSAFNAQMEENLKQGKIVVSCGMALYDSATDNSFRPVFERADAEMYRRKKQLKAMGATMRE